MVGCTWTRNPKSAETYRSKCRHSRSHAGPKYLCPLRPEQNSGRVVYVGSARHSRGNSTEHGSLHLSNIQKKFPSPSSLKANDRMCFAYKHVKLQCYRGRPISGSYSVKMDARSLIRQSSPQKINLHVAYSYFQESLQGQTREELQAHSVSRRIHKFLLTNSKSN